MSLFWVVGLLCFSFSPPRLPFSSNFYNDYVWFYDKKKKHKIMILKIFWWWIDAHESTFPGKSHKQCLWSFPYSLDLVFPRGNFGKKIHSTFLSIFFFSLCPPLLKRRSDFLSWWDSGLGLPQLLSPPLGGVQCTMAAPQWTDLGAGERSASQVGCALFLSAGVHTAGGGRACLLRSAVPLLWGKVYEAANCPTCSWLVRCLPWEPHSEDWGGNEMKAEDLFGHSPSHALWASSARILYLEPMCIHQREKEWLISIFKNVAVSIHEHSFILHT